MATHDPSAHAARSNIQAGTSSQRSAPTHSACSGKRRHPPSRSPHGSPPVSRTTDAIDKDSRKTVPWAFSNLVVQPSAAPLGPRVPHPRTGRASGRITRCPLFRGKITGAPSPTKDQVGPRSAPQRATAPPVDWLACSSSDSIGGRPRLYRGGGSRRGRRRGDLGGDETSDRASCWSRAGTPISGVTARGSALR